eukprot:3390066-Pleurochrysis_carterae.AAC.1
MPANRDGPVSTIDLVRMVRAVMKTNTIWVAYGVEATFLTKKESVETQIDEEPLIITGISWRISSV